MLKGKAINDCRCWKVGLKNECYMKDILSNVCRWFIVKIIVLCGFTVSGQNVGIGTLMPHPSAKMEVQDTIRGILIPRLTTKQRDNIDNPAHSLLIFNIDNFCIEAYDSISKQWLAVSCPAMCNPCDSCPVPTIDTVYGPTAICPGDTVDYIIRGSGYTTVVWNPPLGWLYLGGLDTARFVCGRQGAMHVSLCNDCGCVSYRFGITIGGSQIPITLSGPDSSCVMDTLIIYASGGTWYNWNVPSNWQIVYSGDSLVVVPIDTGMFFIKGQACSVCGCSPFDSVSVYITDTLIDNVSIWGPTFACAGDTVKFHANSQYGSVWYWQYPPSWQLLYQSGDSIMLVPDTTDGNIVVTVCNEGGCKCVSDTLSVAVDSCTTFCVSFGSSGYDILYDVIADGNNIVFGGEISVSSQDAVIAKLDINGNLLWSYVYDGPSGGWDAVTSVNKLPNGNYVFIGWVDAGWSGTWDNQIAEINSITGSIITHRMVYGYEEYSVTVINSGNDILYTGSNNDCGYFNIINMTSGNVTTKYCGPAYGWSVIKHSSGAYYVVGDQLHLCKFSGSGNPQWCYSYGGGSLKWIAELPGGDLIAAGYSNNDIMILRVDTNGNIIWAKRWDAGGSTEVTYYYCCSEMGVVKSNGNVLIVGTTDAGTLGGYNIVVFELDMSGNLVWSRVYGDSGNEYGGAIDVLSNGEIIVGGLTTSFGNGAQDMLIMKLSPNGFINCNSGCKYEEIGSISNVNLSASSLSLPTPSSSPTTNLSGGTTGGNIIKTCP